MTFNIEEYWRSKEHRRHAPGMPEAPLSVRVKTGVDLKASKVNNNRFYCVSPEGDSRIQVDMAWVVMLYKQKLLDRETSSKLLKALKAAGEAENFNGEPWLKRYLNGDEDTASAVNLGRTLQEPMSRLLLRQKIIDLLENVFDTLRTILDKATENIDTVMAGHTHMSQAQPMTYVSYLLSVHDGIQRGIDQLELAYKHTNMNTAGCGALSGTGWPVDRHMITDLLGFDALVEPDYDCEAGQDHALTILFAIANIMVLISRSTIDYGIWTLEEVGIMSLPGEWLSMSSLMPQKAIPGAKFEEIRLLANDAIAEMMRGVTAIQGEPHQDIIPIYEAWRSAVRAILYAEGALELYAAHVNAIICNRKKMLAYAREGFSATADLSIKLIRDCKMGARRAHRICATMVRIARERGIKAYEVTGELLNEAARIADEPLPNLKTEEIRRILDPVEFIKRHNNVGDPAPKESERMIQIRYAMLNEAKKRQDVRKEKLKQARVRLENETSNVIHGV